MYFRKIIFLFLLSACGSFVSAQPIICKDPSTCLYGLKDESGKWITSPRYNLIGNFHGSDRYRVLLNGKYGIIGKSGEEIIPVIYDNIEVPSVYYPYPVDGKRDSAEYNIYRQLYTAYQVTVNDRTGLYDAAGQIILPARYRSLGNFVNNYCIGRDSLGKTCFVGINGTSGYLPEKVSLEITPGIQLLKKRYLVSQFIKVPGTGYQKKYGVCDVTGKMILPCIFENIPAQYSTRGFICVKENGKAGFFTADGVRITESIYAFHETKEGMGRFLIVQRDQRWGVLNSELKETIPCRFDSIRNFANSGDSVYFLCRENKIWGIYSIDGTKLIPADFQQIIPMNILSFSPADIFFSIRVNGKWGAIDAEGKELVATEYDTIINRYSYVLFWSAENCIALHYNTIYTSVALYACQLPPGKYGEDYMLPTEDEAKTLYTGSPVIFQYMLPGDHLYQLPDTSKPYHFGKLLGNHSACTVTHLRQTISADSSWYILHFPEDIEYIESGEEAATLLVKEYRLAVTNKKNGPPEMHSIYPLLADSMHVWLTFGNENYGSRYGASNGIIRNDGEILFDSIPGMSCSGYGFSKDGSPLFYAVSNSNTGRSNIVNKEGRFLIDTSWNSVQYGYGDSVWVFHRMNKTDCMTTCNLLVISTGQTILSPDEEFLEPVMLAGRQTVIAGTKKGYGLFDTNKKKFISAFYRFVIPLNYSDSYYSVMSFSGKTGIINKKGTLVVDTAWDKIVQSAANEYYWEDKFNFRFILSSENSSAIFDRKGLHPADEKWKKKAVGDVLRRPPFRNYWYAEYITEMAVDSTTHFENWQYDLLYDSIFLTPLRADYRYEYDRRHFEFNSQLDNHCESWPSAYDAFDSRHGCLTHELSMAGPNILSFRRTKRFYNSSWQKPEDLSYQNFILVNGKPEYITLDSLFTGNEWRNFITDTITRFLESHPHIESPCVNANAYPYLLNERFLLDKNGLSLYPDWKDKENSSRWEIEILIPWEKLKPYLRADMASKIGI